MNKSNPSLTQTWKQVYELGNAGEVCDLIVRDRPVLSALLSAIGRASHRHVHAAGLPAYVRESLRGADV